MITLPYLSSLCLASTHSTQTHLTFSRHFQLSQQLLLIDKLFVLNVLEHALGYTRQFLCGT